MEYGGYAPAMTGRPDQLRQAADLRRDNVHFGHERPDPGVLDESAYPPIATESPHRDK
jgi:hypothetical protein